VVNMKEERVKVVTVQEENVKVLSVKMARLKQEREKEKRIQKRRVLAKRKTTLAATVVGSEKTGVSVQAIVAFRLRDSNTARFLCCSSQDSTDAVTVGAASADVGANAALVSAAASLGSVD
jgi:hypothetical protein